MLDENSIQPLRRRNFSTRIKRRYDVYKGKTTVAPNSLSTKHKQRRTKQTQGGPVKLNVKTYVTPTPTRTETKQEANVPVMLPRHLERPARSQPDVEIPDCSEVPPDFVRDSFATIGAVLFHSLARTRTVLDSHRAGCLPRSVQISIPDNEERPDHILAAYTPQGEHVTLFPVHDIVLQAHCQNFPGIPPLDDLQPGHVPVQPFCIPHVASYAPLSQYLYIHRQDLLFATLCAPLKPPPFFSAAPHMSTSPLPTATKEDMLAFCRELAETYTQHKLLQAISMIHGMWKNVVALRIFDEGVWQVLDVAWGVFLSAVAWKIAGTSTGELLPSFEESL